jgi:hypothetical protein
VSFDDLAAEISAGAENERNQLAIIVLDDLCSRFAFVRRAWGLGDPDRKGGLLRYNNLSPEGIARGCNHAITKRGLRYIAHVVRGPLGLTANG